MTLRLLDYLKHVRDAIECIDKYVLDVSEVDFLEGGMVADAVIRNYEIIGEACHSIESKCPEFGKAYPNIPLRVAYEMRNALAHGYYKVDLEIVWSSIQCYRIPEIVAIRGERGSYNQFSIATPG